MVVVVAVVAAAVVAGTDLVAMIIVEVCVVAVK
jgi:hypothetical protein